MEPTPLSSRANTASSTSSTPSMSPSRSAAPASFSASRPSANHAGLSLDLSSLPTPAAAAAASAPPTPTNTLLLTNLVHADVFRPDNLQTIRELVEQTAPLHSWAPLKSFRRVVASFYSADDASRVRAAWDGATVLGELCHVYYGKPTPVDDRDGCTSEGGPNGELGQNHSRFLSLPDAGKLFFISPPPSPPHDWEMRLEGAPNKQVHADDLAEALQKLRHQAAMPADEDIQESDSSSAAPPAAAASRTTTRSRSSTLIYQPADHGCSSHLPAIAVEDMTDEPFDDPAPAEAAQEHLPSPPASSLTYDGFGMPGQRPAILAHTARPPLELMHDA